MAQMDATRAAALVGVPFRAQGRDAARGLDCVGLVIVAFDLPRDMARRDYRLRGDHRDELVAGLRQHFRRVSTRKRRTGDLLLVAVAADQFHLGIFTDRGFVHADARLGQVVETPGMPRWPLIAIYRRRTRRRVEK